MDFGSGSTSFKPKEHRIPEITNQKYFKNLSLRKLMADFRCWKKKMSG